MPAKHFDIAIIGAGAAGLHLAMALNKSTALSGKEILILEKAQKDQNDRTWCFWEQGEGLWDSILAKSWARGYFYAPEKEIDLNLLPYRYKMLRAIDFYEYGKKQILKNTHVTWLNDEVMEVGTGSPISIKGQNDTYTATHVFDSRIPPAFLDETDKYTRLLQHFKGWVIETPQDTFDPERFTMMDYRLTWPGTTSFTYVLPINAKKALIEFTFFSPELIKEEGYDKMLKKYISEMLEIEEFKLLEEEQGIIPMSDFPFERYSKGNHIRIGTAGGWVKPSSGYAFKNCERYAHKLVRNLEQGKPANKGLIHPRFRWYDSILLGVLSERNDYGPELFSTMFSKNDIQFIFSFLDDESTLLKDIQMMARFEKWPFMKSLFRYMTR
jgi:lycopene beta-cyclase